VQSVRRRTHIKRGETTRKFVAFPVGRGEGGGGNTEARNGKDTLKKQNYY